MSNRRLYELENYSLDNARLLLNETLFHNANGYIGVRYVFEEGYPDNMSSIPGQYINGFYDFVKMYQAENPLRAGQGKADHAQHRRHTAYPYVS